MLMSEPSVPLLVVDDLAVVFATASGDIHAVDGVSFAIAPGEIFCMVGESGCGKSASALSIPRLLPSPPARRLRGRVLFDGLDLALCPEGRLESIRGSRIGMVFQEPMTSLNPVFRVGEQIAEVLLRHKEVTRDAAHEAAVRLLGEVGIPDPASRVFDFPHQMSGGMRQRVMIAMALACEPQLLIADEPTTALDVTVQRQVLSLLRGLTREKAHALLLITHNLRIVADMADHVAVMYCGKIVESAPARELFANPLHPYTLGLMRSHPDIDPGSRFTRLPVIPGAVPNPLRRPSGCAFRDRCGQAHARCREMPPLYALPHGHECRCWLREGAGS